MVISIMNLHAVMVTSSEAMGFVSILFPDCGKRMDTKPVA